MEVVQVNGTKTVKRRSALIAQVIGVSRPRQKKTATKATNGVFKKYGRVGGIAGRERRSCPAMDILRINRATPAARSGNMENSLCTHEG